jgi:hypothetical protein
MTIARWLPGLATLEVLQGILPATRSGGRTHAPVKAVIVDGGEIHDVDLMACELLVELERELAERGIRLVFGNLRDRVKRDIERGLPPLPAGEEVSFPASPRRRRLSRSNDPARPGRSPVLWTVAAAHGVAYS